MNRLLIAVAFLAASSLVACGGSHSCGDVASANAKCAASLGYTPGITETQCSQAVCTNKQKAIDCIVNLQCPATVDAYDTAFTACLAQGGCL